MFYQFDNEAVSVDLGELKDNEPAVGYVSVGELAGLQKRFNLPAAAVEMCRDACCAQCCDVDVYDSCYFIRLRILSEDAEAAGTAGVFVLQNLILIVNINDCNFVNRDLFMKLMSRVHSDNVTAERLISSFFECLVVRDDVRLDGIRKSIAELEESVIKNEADNGFNIRLLKIKREIFSYRSYYERLIDISQTLCENDNDMLDDEIKKLSHFVDKTKRLKDSTDVLADSVVHLWDAYQTSLDMRLSQTMKIFTLLSTVFFPLTVIVGWYGMNFSSMPELRWRYGYVYVILLSIAVIGALIYWFKKKKWI